MARAYGQIMSAIWNDPAFRALSGEEQRVYLMLITQATISSCGVLALTVGRWATYARDTTSDGLRDALSGLAGMAFLVVDEDTEEVLVRKFVKWDNGYTNDKRRPAISAAAGVVVSQQIRATLAVELDALGVPHSLSDGLSHGLSDRHPDSPRVVVTKGEYEPNPEPQPTTQGRGPMPTPPDGDAPASPFCAKHPNGTSENCRDCATARRRFDAWHRERPSREAARRADAERRRAELANCPDCGGGHWREDGTKCDHSRRSA
jgi:hypothetical protein